MSGKYTIGSLFSGIGGIELGFESTGKFRTIWTCDIAEYPSAVLSERFGLPNLGDITKVDWNAVERPDVLVGGFPCQDISNAGKRVGITGQRSGLWKEYVKAIKTLRPKYVVAENVAALVNRGLDVVVEDLNAIGYRVEARIIAARDVGAPHRRERIFIVAYAESERCGTSRELRCDESSQWTLAESPLANSDGEVRSDEQLGCGIVQRYILQEDGWSEASDRPNTGGVRSYELSDALGVGLETSKRQSAVLRRTVCEGTHSIAVSSAWEVEPNVGRVVNGIPRGMDSYVWRERIKALGNAVVPQVAAEVAKRVIELEMLRCSDDGCKRTQIVNP